MEHLLCCVLFAVAQSLNAHHRTPYAATRLNSHHSRSAASRIKTCKHPWRLLATISPAVWSCQALMIPEHGATAGLTGQTLERRSNFIYISRCSGELFGNLQTWLLNILAHYKGSRGSSRLMHAPHIPRKFQLANKRAGICGKSPREIAPPFYPNTIVDIRLE